MDKHNIDQVIFSTWQLTDRYTLIKHIVHIKTLLHLNKIETLDYQML